MSNAGKQVEVEYVGTLDDGTKFDASADHGETLKFVCGAGMMIPGFDKAVESMEVGQTTTVVLPPEEAYGEYTEEAVQSVPVANIPNGDQLPVGKRIYMSTDQGMMPMLVKSIEDGIATFDMNHPLAGKTLTFEITLVSVEDGDHIEDVPAPGVPMSEAKGE